jgi:hypothetical protein
VTQLGIVGFVVIIVVGIGAFIFIQNNTIIASVMYKRKLLFAMVAEPLQARFVLCALNDEIAPLAVLNFLVVNQDEAPTTCRGTLEHILPRKCILVGMGYISCPFIVSFAQLLNCTMNKYIS